MLVLRYDYFMPLSLTSANLLRAIQYFNIIRTFDYWASQKNFTAFILSQPIIHLVYITNHYHEKSSLLINGFFFSSFSLSSNWKAIGYEDSTNIAISTKNQVILIRWVRNYRPSSPVGIIKHFRSETNFQSRLSISGLSYWSRINLTIQRLFKSRFVKTLHYLSERVKLNDDINWPKSG